MRRSIHREEEGLEGCKIDDALLTIEQLQSLSEVSQSVSGKVYYTCMALSKDPAAT